MRYLVDANVLSEPTKPFPHPAVVEWLRKNERDIAVDPIVLGEVRYGILLPRELGVVPTQPSHYHSYLSPDRRDESGRLLRVSSADLCAVSLGGKSELNTCGVCTRRGTRSAISR